MLEQVKSILVLKNGTKNSLLPAVKDESKITTDVDAHLRLLAPLERVDHLERKSDTT